jgi:hypothetical protein
VTVVANVLAWLSSLLPRSELGSSPKRIILAVLSVGGLIALGIASWPLLPFLWELLPGRSRDLLGQVSARRSTAATLALAGLLAAAVVGWRWMLLPTGLGWRILGAWATAILLVALIVAALWLVLGLPGLDTTPTVSPRALDAIATRAFAIVAGLGGVALLVIAYQRQSGEQTRLFTERFTTAVAQLGEEQPAVRLGGVHALAHLADDAPTPGLRQMCVDVLCAYLRNPGPDDLPQGSSDNQQQTHHARVVEHAAMREVRLTIVRTISQRLRTPTPWRDCDFDFTGVTFEHDFILKDAVCRGRMDFAQATFTDDASFWGATFTDETSFWGATFTKIAGFWGATFKGGAYFLDATFTTLATFAGATFGDDAEFKHAIFNDRVGFGDATFKGGAYFHAAAFTNEVSFRGATFKGGAYFLGATFTGKASFLDSTFSRGANFQGEGTNDGPARGPCPLGLLAIAQASEGRVRLPRRWTYLGRVRLKNPPPPQEPEGAPEPRQETP